MPRRTGTRTAAQSAGTSSGGRPSVIPSKSAATVPVTFCGVAKGQGVEHGALRCYLERCSWIDEYAICERCSRENRNDIHGIDSAMTSEPKAVARRRKLRDALIAAAERTIEADGLRGLRARDLALRVGCAVGAIYNVFADLDDLVFAVNALTLEQ